MPARLRAASDAFEVTSLREVPEKEAIATRATELVRPGMAIAITAGSTCSARGKRVKPEVFISTSPATRLWWWMAASAQMAPPKEWPI